MKIKHDLAILLLIIGLSRGEKLGSDENRMRATGCGAEYLPLPENGDGKEDPMELPRNSWLVKVGLIAESVPLVGSSPNKSAVVTFDYTALPEFVLGSFISNRHIITSSQPVMDDHSRWIFDKTTPIKDEQYVKNTTHLEVPMDVLNKKWTLYVTRQIPTPLPRPEDVPKVKRAWILRFLGQRQVDRMRSPMLIELESDDKIMYKDITPCLIDKDLTLTNQDAVSIYGLNPNNRSRMIYRNRTIYGYEGAEFIRSPKYYAPLDRGGPMLRHDQGRVVLVGIGASPPFNDNADGTYFFDIRRLLPDLCSLAGICALTPADLLTTLPPTTPVATQPAPETTEEPETTPEPTEQPAAEPNSEPIQAPAPAPQPPAPTEAPVPAQPNPPPNTPSPTGAPEKIAEDDYVDNPQAPEAQAQIASEKNASHSVLLMASAVLTLFIHLVIDF